MKAITLFLGYLLVAYTQTLYANNHATDLCKKNGFSCYKVQKNDTWKTLFPDEMKRDLVMRLNKINITLTRGRIIAIPLASTTNLLDFSPLPNHIRPTGNKLIKISLSQHLFGAYNAQGVLERWGAVSGAKGYCPDIHRRCRTPVGEFSIYRREGGGCVSSKYPVGKGGAPMPYCMFFHHGFALHGSYDVPGYNASHGCVRLFVNDAKWLNQEFSAGEKTKVIIEP